MSYPFQQKEDALEAGIYFGLDERLYHQDSALSRSGITKLNKETPLEFWINSWMNGTPKPQLEKDSMKWGKAFHTLMLEPEEFSKRYYISPGEIYDPKRSMVKDADFTIMKDALAVLKGHGHLEALFSTGYPEVAIVWPDPETGLLLRGKLDYLQTFLITDLKTSYSTRNDKLKWTFKEGDLHIQYVMYLDGITIIRQMLRQGRADVFGDVDEKWLEDFVNEDDMSFVFAIQKVKWPYPVRLFKSLDEADIDDARQDIRFGIEEYIYHLKKYGTKTWPVSEIQYEDFSMRYGTVRQRRNV